MNTKRAVYTFIGNSVWKDDKGQLWCAKQHDNPDVQSTRTLDVDGRDDLEFMVKYGEMKKVDIDETPVSDVDGNKDGDGDKDDSNKDKDVKKDVKIDIKK